MKLLRYPRNRVYSIIDFADQCRKDVRRAARLAAADPDAVREAERKAPSQIDNGDVFKWFVEDAMKEEAASRQAARPRNLP